MSEWQKMATAERLLARSKPDEQTGCRNWIGTVRSELRPYGQLTVGRRGHDRKTVSAHRLSYEVFVGPIPANLCVCHHCDNPRCINPSHLFVGTKKDNADDRDRKGRNIPAPHPVGEAHPSAKLTDAQVEAIRASTKPSRVVADEYGIGDSYVRQLRRGEFRRTPDTRKE